MIRKSLEDPRCGLNLDSLTEWSLRVELLVLTVKFGEVADHLQQLGRRVLGHEF